MSRLAWLPLLALSCVAANSDPGPASVARATPGLASRVPSTRQRPRHLEVSLPLRGDAPLRLRAGDAWIEITPLDRASGVMSREEGLVEHREVAPSTDALFVVDGDRVEELRVLRDERAKTVSRARLAASPGIRFREIDGTVEAIDAHCRVVFVSERPFLVDARGVRRDVRVTLVGDRLELDFDRGGLAFPVVVDPTWAAVASMSAGRLHGTLTLLSSGKVLAVGGEDVSTAEVYDVAANKWTAAGALSTARTGHTASAVAGGKVLVAGGANASSTLSTAQLWDGSAFAAPIAMKSARRGHTATVLPSGKVLLVGGGTSTAEVFDPAASTFVAVASMAASRTDHSASLLPSGKVLVVGGTTDPTIAEIYDPGSNAWSAASTGLSQKRSLHGAAVLPSGKVLVFGGNPSSGGFAGLSTADLFDVATSTWTAGSPLGKARTEAPSVQLSSGAIVYAGGAEGAGFAFSSSAEIYDPSAGKWADAPALTGLRFGASGVRLADGRVMIAGGGEPDLGFGGGPPYSTAEIFDPGVAGTTCKGPGDCASGACADGVCCDRACSGQCEACDLPGKVGTCSFVTGAPRGARRACSGAATCTGTTFTPGAACDGAGTCAAAAKDCGAYACTAAGCRESCTSADQCAANHVCTAGTCVPQASAVCEAGNGASIAGDGSRTACSAYLCDPGTGRCRDKCTASSECATGFACDGTACRPSAPSDASEDSGGCGFGRAGASGLGLLGLALAALAIARRSTSISRS